MRLPVAPAVGDSAIGEFLRNAPADRWALLGRGAGLGLAAASLGGFGGWGAGRDDEAATSPAAVGNVGSDPQAPSAGDASPVPAGTPAFTLYDPWLAPVEPGAKAFEVVARDAVLQVAGGVPCAAWTFDGSVPGRALRVREGDPVRVTFRAGAAANAHHSPDFHSAKTPPDRDFRTINPGEEIAWSFVATTPGAYMYHCGTPPAPMHVGAGLYGATIVDPKDGWPPARGLVFVQSGFYLREGEAGVMAPDYAKMPGGGQMDYVVFNGDANQYVENPIEVKVGEPVRIFVVNAGPNPWSSFHVVGGVFDKAYVNANPANELRGLQSVAIGPGDGACVELTVDEPGEYAAVNHAFGHAAHGAIAILPAT